MSGFLDIGVRFDLRVLLHQLLHRKLVILYNAKMLTANQSTNEATHGFQLSNFRLVVNALVHFQTLLLFQGLWVISIIVVVGVEVLLCTQVISDINECESTMPTVWVGWILAPIGHSPNVAPLHSKLEPPEVEKSCDSID